MPKRRTLFLLASILFVLFVCFSYVVHKDVLVHFDFNTTVKLQNHISRKFDLFFSYFSVLGSFETTTIMLLIFIAIFWRKKSALLMLFSFGVILFFELFGKIFITHPGPPMRFARYKHLVNFPLDYVPHPTSAYPSGHSGRTLFLSTIFILLILHTKKLSTHIKIALIAGILVYDFIMVLSRVYLGEHWTTDIIGGSLLGASLGLFTGMFLTPSKKSS